MRDIDKTRLKTARDRRKAQRAKRKRTWTGNLDKNCQTLKRVAENERKRREAPPISYAGRPQLVHSSRRQGQYRNPGKAAVRMDRAVRKERQRLQKKMRNADRSN